jgi:exodeoxyribonuclease VII large subunit
LDRLGHDLHPIEAAAPVQPPNGVTTRLSFPQMAQLPFDPSRMSGPRKTPKTSARRESKKYGSVVDAERLTVSQLTRLIDETLKDHVPRPIRVVGEVSGLRDRSHLYFDLKDADAVIACVAFANVARRISFEMANGLEVVVSGRVEHYAKQGKTQLYASKIEPVGAGALEQAFRKLCEELRALGYFDASTKLALPTFPRRVAVVTSRSGAALQDVLDTIRRRCPAVDVAVVDVRVQGDEAAGEIARAIRGLGRLQQRQRIDAIILTRGGGSMEDLWAFNERVVADAIHACRIPIVAAIGHETDTTVAELTADVRAATPTQAAMRVTPDSAALAEQVAMLRGRLHRGVTMLLRHERQRLVAASRHAVFSDPAGRLAQSRHRLEHRMVRLAASLRQRAHADSLLLTRLEAALRSRRPAEQSREARERLAALSDRMMRVMHRRVEQDRQRIGGLHRELTISGPERVLQRGYSYTMDASGRLVRSIGDVRTGDALRTRVRDGEIHSTVSDSDADEPGPEPPAERAAPETKRGRRRAKSDDAGQMDLFKPTE